MSKILSSQVISSLQNPIDAKALVQEFYTRYLDYTDNDEYDFSHAKMLRRLIDAARPISGDELVSEWCQEVLNRQTNITVCATIQATVRRASQKKHQIGYHTATFDMTHGEYYGDAQHDDNFWKEHIKSTALSDLFRTLDVTEIISSIITEVNVCDNGVWDKLDMGTF